MLGYHCMFIPGFSSITAPITQLFSKNIPFEWTPDCIQAIRELKKCIIAAPVLVHPDPSKQFELEVNVSQIATGAILYQREPPVQRPDGMEKPGPHYPVRFYSQKFTSTKQNYPIYDWEFLAIMHGLRNWDYLLKGTEKPVLIYTNHASLHYYHDPRKIGPGVAGYLPECKQYNMLLEYKPGTSNQADSLSRREDHDNRSNPDNEDIIVWPDKYFCKQHTSIQATSMDRSNPGNRQPGGDGCIQVMDWNTLENNLDSKIKLVQYQNQDKLKIWATAFKQITLADRMQYYHGNALVVMVDNKLRRGVTSLFHDQLTAGHPGISKTLQLILPYYWWPNMKVFITDYICRCATCQINKVNTHPSHPPLLPITPAENTCPFKTIAIDFITKLLLSGDYNTILTITNIDCSKASIFLPCKETINSEGVVQLYLMHVLLHYGLPKKIISDWDPQFTSCLGKELCCLLDIWQNISTAYHPQTDGASKHANQYLEQYLHMFYGIQQNKWHAWLSIA